MKLEGFNREDRESRGLDVDSDDSFITAGHIWCNGCFD